MTSPCRTSDDDDDDNGMALAWGNNQDEESQLTLDLERVSPLASTQTYSAMMEPFWSSLRYLFNCSIESDFVGMSRLGLGGGVVDTGSAAPRKSSESLLLHTRSFPEAAEDQYLPQNSICEAEDSWLLVGKR